jgi:predicted  nucleic acid-binding Zn-ribbon protein
VENNKINIIIDIKSIVIILLSLLVVGLIFFKNSDKDIEKYRQEIDNLNKVNKELLLNNDSLKNLNLGLSKDIIKLNDKIDDINIILESNESLINRLKKRKSEIPTNVNVMDADGVASGISDYLKRRD